MASCGGKEWKCPEIPNVKLNTGHEIPLVGFGTYKVVGADAIHKCVDSALAYGYRHFDTAKLYKNEPELGASLEELLPKYGLKREDIFLTTKFFPPAEGAAEKVPQLVEESLTNLRTKYLDLVLIHYPKSDEREHDDEMNPTNRRDAWLALEAIPASKIHSIGVSNYESGHIEEMAGYATRIRVPAVNQVEYHPHFRRATLKKYCDERGIFFQAFSSLARMHPDLIGDPVVVRLAEEHSTSVGTILLSFATSQRVGIVPKSENPDRIRDNLECLRVPLSPEEVRELNSIEKDGNYIRTTGWLVK